MTNPLQEQAASNTWSWLADMLSYFGPLTIPFIVMVMALLRYFIQKDNEQNRKRYLDEGFDAMVSQVEEALQVYRHNWSNGLAILKVFRDMREETDPGICKDRAMELPYQTFAIAPSYRIQLLLKDEDYIIWKIQQKLFAFVKRSSDMISTDLCSAIRVYLQHKEEKPNPYEAAVEKAMQLYWQDFRDQKLESGRYHIFLAHLQKMAYYFDNIWWLTKGRARKFGKKKEVLDLLSELKRHFNDILAEEEIAKEEAKRVQPTPTSTGSQPDSPSERA